MFRLSESEIFFDVCRLFFYLLFFYLFCLFFRLFRFRSRFCLVSVGPYPVVLTTGLLFVLVSTLSRLIKEQKKSMEDVEIFLPKCLDLINFGLKCKKLNM